MVQHLHLMFHLDSQKVNVILATTKAFCEDTELSDKSNQLIAVSCFAISNFCSFRALRWVPSGSGSLPLFHLFARKCFFWHLNLWQFLSCQCLSGVICKEDWYKDFLYQRFSALTITMFNVFLLSISGFFKLLLWKRGGRKKGSAFW